MASQSDNLRGDGLAHPLRGAAAVGALAALLQWRSRGGAESAGPAGLSVSL